MAGRPGSPDFGRWLHEKASGDGRIVLRLENLTETEFRSALGVCDTIVAPLRDYLHSGSIVHALSAERPVLTPATPFSIALRGQVGAEWMRLYDGPLTPELLQAAMQPPVAGQILGLSDFDTKAVGHQAAGFFRELISNNS